MNRFWHVRSARTLALMVSFALVLTASTLVALACILRLATGQWPGAAEQGISTVSNMHFTDPLAVIAMVVLAVLGLLLMFSALLPGRRQSILLTSDDPAAGSEQAISCRGISALVGHEVERTDSVTRASVITSPGLVHVRVQTPAHSVQRVRDNAQARVQRVIDGLPLRRAPKIKVSVQRRGGN
ncbi:DUF6286 domain-containing protein [Glutamicibacter sp. JL.03c]|uniref:DUF6286 domain-containing protein n=1 Tax=Glutamicibacter sp. JL.03c TaxID=2984842 RepID=UPI0021F6E800|nr:DUF6286 domain-containing protein [Glutamicibacter sp. JL.03c]UYQ77402.1 DUF6286 domain-containing protein [Glutamicibacter sp. JL.03c]